MATSFWSFVFSWVQTLGKCNQDVSLAKSEMQDLNPTIPKHVSQYKTYLVPKDLQSIHNDLFPSASPYTGDHKKLQIYEDKCSYTCCKDTYMLSDM